MIKEVTLQRRTLQTYPIPRAFNLIADPREQLAVVDRIQNFWVLTPVVQILEAHRTSFKGYPPVAPGTPDPVGAPGTSGTSGTPRVSGDVGRT